HFDHTDNNAPLRAAGATLVAHENTRLRMTQPHHLAVLELDFPPSPAAALPQRVFKDGYKLEANGERVTVSHVPPAHTDTDVVVVFEKAKVLHTGDVFFNGRYPFVDGSTGGRIDGMIAAADRVLGLADADTKIVPGHGPLATKADLAKHRDMLSQAADRARKLKASAKSLEDAIAAKLSLSVSEQLGQDVAHERVDWFNAVDATYRSDLRGLNELNFARFDAKVEQRWLQLDAKLEQRLAQVEAKLEQRLAQADT